MWACRSLFNRPQPLVSRLRHVRRHASQPSPVLGVDNLISSRRYASSSNGDSHAEEIKREGPAAATKQYLYVVLDDHKDGYGIHKLDIDEDDAGLDGDVRRLTEPPVLRVGFLDRVAQFAAVGNSIIAIWNGESLDERYYSGGILFYDTNTGAQSLSPRIPEGLANQYGVYEAAMAVGNRLYIIESSHEMWNSRWDDDDDIFPGGLHCLSADPAGGDDGDAPWYWKPLSSSSRWRWGTACHYPTLPFWGNLGRIKAHAVHATPGPGAAHHDIYVSSEDMETGVTFSVCTASGKWTRRGDWQMPIIGHAHYDGELDTWVGLHAVQIEEYSDHTDGRLCTGHVTSAPLEWKVGSEKLFRLDEDIAAGWTHMDAKLVPMSSCEGRSEYCLMERLQSDEDDEKCLLRLTCFLVERGKDGEPVISNRRLVRSYKVSRYNTRFDAQVFWI